MSAAACALQAPCCNAPHAASSLRASYTSPLSFAPLPYCQSLSLRAGASACQRASAFGCIDKSGTHGVSHHRFSHTPTSSKAISALHELPIRRCQLASEFWGGGVCRQNAFAPAPMTGRRRQRGTSIQAAKKKVVKRRKVVEVQEVRSASFSFRISTLSGPLSCLQSCMLMSSCRSDSGNGGN